MAATLPKIKRGDTFSYQATWAGADVSELKSQVRDSVGNLISEVKIEATGTDTFELSVEKTSHWPITTLYTDIQRNVGGVVQSTATIAIPVVKDVTQ